MSKERFKERQASARDSAARLIEAVRVPKSDIVRDAVIQRFEFTFETVWRALKIFLEHQGHECPGSRTVIRKAFAEGLIESPNRADAWFQMLEDRNLTTHAYDEELADKIYDHIVNGHAELLGGMAARLQELKWDSE